VLDEVFVRAADDTLRFCPAAPPTDDDVRRVVARVRRRLERVGVTARSGTDDDVELLAEVSAALARSPRPRCPAGRPWGAGTIPPQSFDHHAEGGARPGP
jgi:hypothetical protein